MLLLLCDVWSAYLQLERGAALHTRAQVHVQQLAQRQLVMLTCWMQIGCVGIATTKALLAKIGGCADWLASSLTLVMCNVVWLGPLTAIKVTHLLHAV